MSPVEGFLCAPAPPPSSSSRCAAFFVFFSSVFSVGQTKISSAAWPITRVNSVGAAGEEAEGRSWVDNPLVAEPHFEFNR